MKRWHVRSAPAWYLLGRRRWVLTAAALAAALAAGAAAASASSPADFRLAFSSRTPSTVTAIKLHILYKNPHHPGDSSSPPPPLTRVTIKTPPGTVINGSAVPACRASDQQLMAEGASACPRGSIVGGGTGSVIVGTGPAASTYLLNATLINYGGGIIELFTDRRTGATVTDDRARFTGPGTMVLHPPVVPGITEREFDFTYDALRGPSGRAFITTPARCPSSDEWISTLDYTVSGGASYSVSSTTPCTRPSATHRTKAHRRARHCRAARRAHHAGHHSSRRRDPDHDGDRD